ncbi:MAG TPA: AAA family ATPase, partial [Chloroflexia bacterium]
YFTDAVPRVEIISEFRVIEKTEDKNYRLNGRNLVELLARYGRPELENDQDLIKFERIQKFAQTLLHLPTARLEVSDRNRTLILNNEGLRLPLTSYGTGVHELIILITAVLSLEDEPTICCIEEPEIHMHPTLQREFVDFIVKETKNTYLLSTHSPTFINIRNSLTTDIQPCVQLFRLSKEAGATIGGPVLTDSESLVALEDLGVRASDILQSNCVIWVEGPSDRIYLNHWIHLLDSSLIEGVHYSVMYYGGRLLAHLGVKRESIRFSDTKDHVSEVDGADDLIQLLRVNQHTIILIDSDRKKDMDTLNATKQRVCAECEMSDGLCWVTDGREIENYLPEDVVITICKLSEVRGTTITFHNQPFAKFEIDLDKALERVGAKAIHYQNNKIKYAQLFVRAFRREHLDAQLERRVRAVIDKILSWNSPQR